MEYLVITVFGLIIVVSIFSVALFTSDQEVKIRQTSESLDNIIQTADLVYAMGPGNVLVTEVQFPQEITDLSVIHNCYEACGTPCTASQKNGCLGGQVATCSFQLPITRPEDCIQYSALNIEGAFFGNESLIYPSRAKLSGTGLLVTNVRYKIKATSQLEADNFNVVILQRVE